MQERENLVKLGKYKNDRNYRQAFKLKVLEDAIACNESDSFIERKHGIGDGSLRHFKKSILTKLGYYRILEDVKKQSESSAGIDLSQENEKLKKALELAMMKVQALEVLIEVAEDQLNVDIRKKGESKQSK